MIVFITIFYAAKIWGNNLSNDDHESKSLKLGKSKSAED